jgi:hypothetical protein
MINMSDSDRTFEILEGQPGEWSLAFDTGRSSPYDFPEQAIASPLESSSYVVGQRSIAGFIRRGT